MGFIATIIDILKRALRIDSGGGNIITAENYLPSGDDSKPLKSDYPLAVTTLKSGAAAVVGFTDLKNEPKAAQGEKRLYSRDPNTGITIAEFWLKGDGSIRGSNSLGFFELDVGGNFKTNGVTINPSGNIDAPSITINGIPFGTHVHGGVTVGAGTTGVPQ